MPDGKVILIAMAVGITIWAGHKVTVETRDHVVKPVYRYVLKPVGCGTAKVFTLGHKECATKK